MLHLSFRNPPFSTILLLEIFLAPLSVLQHFIAQAEYWSTKVPLALFAFGGSITEEFIAPIPSPVVMMTAGAVAKAQQYSLWGVVLIIVLAAVGKTLGALLYYWVGMYFSHLLTGRLGLILGITPSVIAKWHSVLKHRGMAWTAMIGLRSLPPVPSTPVSVACGVLGMNLSQFVASTLIGFIIRSSLMVMAGYLGSTALINFTKSFDSWESLLTLVTAVVVLGGIVLAYGIHRYGWFGRSSLFDKE